MLDSVTWLITRKCRMGCSYCSWMKHSTKEASLEDKLRAMDLMAAWPRAKERFQCLLGGDILWADGYIDIVKRLNELDLPYGFCTSAFDYKRMEDVLPYLRNLSLSVDPAATDGDFSRWAKASAGLYWAGRLQAINKGADIHATLTVDRGNIGNVIPTVKMLSSMGIWSEITMIHWAKKNYDLVDMPASISGFSDLDSDRLEDMAGDLLAMREKDFLIHTSAEQLRAIPEHAINLDWQCTKPNVLVIDFDLSLRMCLHIPGSRVRKWTVFDLTTEQAWEEFYSDWYKDQKEYCSQCFWDCAREVELSSDVDGWFQHKG